MSEAQPLLEVRGLVQALRRRSARSNDLSMAIRPGEVVALAGDNGAGKTTLIKTISGVFRPTAGEILLRGEPIHFATPQEARDRGIETIYQDLALADNLSIGANIFLGREPMTPGLRLPAGARPQEDGAGGAGRPWRCSTSTSPASTRRFSNFSGGQRQAVAIGRAVHWDAQILIMDEPTAALGRARAAQGHCADPSAQGAGARDHLHLAQPSGHFRRRPTASSSCAAASRPASAGSPRPPTTRWSS